MYIQQPRDKHHLQNTISCTAKQHKTSREMCLITSQSAAYRNAVKPAIYTPQSVIRPQCFKFYSFIIVSCRFMHLCRLSANDRFELKTKNEEPE